jgi:serine protease Do
MGKSEARPRRRRLSILAAPFVIITIVSFLVLAATRSPDDLEARFTAVPLLAEQLQQLFSDLAKRIRPAVVAVGSTELIEIGSDDEEAGADEPSIDPPGGVKRSSLGSGVIVDPRGYILTNSHVVGSGDNLHVTLWNKRRLGAEVVQRDEALDIALIKVEHPSLEAIPMGDSDRLQVGHWVVAVGNPFGLSHTVSAGIVSALGRSDIGILPHESFIQTDASIHQGNSGGPLVDLGGELIGINTAIYSGPSGSNLGIGFAVPVNLVKGLISRWIDGKDVAFLGIHALNVDDDMASYFRLDERQGAFIASVKEGSPASRAGLKEKDVILRFNGAEVRDAGHLRVLISESEADVVIAMDVLRRGERLALQTSLGRKAPNPQPDVASAAVRRRFESDRNSLGITVSPVNADIASQLGIPDGIGGIAVLEVDLNSPADSKGIRVGDVITEANDVRVQTIRDFREALEGSHTGVMLRILRSGREPSYLFFRKRP